MEIGISCRRTHAHDLRLPSTGYMPTWKSWKWCAINFQCADKCTHTNNIITEILFDIRESCSSLPNKCVYFHNFVNCSFSFRYKLIFAATLVMLFWQQKQRVYFFIVLLLTSVRHCCGDELLQRFNFIIINAPNVCLQIMNELFDNCRRNGKLQFIYRMSAQRKCACVCVGFKCKAHNNCVEKWSGALWMIAILYTYLSLQK